MNRSTCHSPARCSPRRVCPRLLSAAVLLLLLQACASSLPAPTDSTDAAAETPASGQVSDNNGNKNEVTADSPQETADSETEAAEEEIEYGHFSEDVLARTIIAELAMQRGRNTEALEAYVELARETGNLSLIQRAMRLATYLRNTGASLELGEMWLEQEPDSTDARQMMAVQLVFTGRYREALDQMIYLLERDIDIDFRLIPARSANDANAALILDALIADYQELQQRFPQSRSLRLGLTMLYQQNDQIEEAYQSIAALARELDDSPEVLMQEIQLLEQLGREKEASRRLEQSLAEHPRHKQLRFMYGRKLISEQRYKQAKEQFTILVDQDPRDFDMLYSLALLSMEMNMFSDARTYLQRLVLNGQRLDDAHYFLGYISNQEGRKPEAIEHFLQVKGGNNFMQALRSLTELMVEAGRYPEVRAHLQNVRFRNTEYNIPLLGMEASVLIESEHYNQAEELLDSAIGAFPNNIQLLFQRSVLNQELNNLALMEQDLRRIILLDPTNPVAYNSLGYTLADRTDRYQEAYDLIQRAVELAPNDPAIIDSLGWVQFKLGMLEQARDNLEHAYELFPDPEVAAHLGEVLWTLGERNAARRLWQKALQVAPDSEFILNAMERLAPGASR